MHSNKACSGARGRPGSEMLELDCYRQSGGGATAAGASTQRQPAPIATSGGGRGGAPVRALAQ